MSDVAESALFLASCLLIGSTFVVVVQYYLTWKRADPRRPLLPLHVWTVALSYDTFVAAVAVQAYAGSLAWWQWWFFVPAVALGAPAMIALARLQHPYGHRGSP